jgi:acetyltransferase
MRFFTATRELSAPMLVRLTQIDYDREMALVLVDAAGEIAAIGRIAADPDNTRAEFALIVRSDLGHHGLGPLLMQRLRDYALSRGIGELWGDIFAENLKMISLCRDAGCDLARSPRDATVLRATFNLAHAAQAHRAAF